jgi:hypothetical protein
VACYAVLRSMLLAMARQAGAHVMSYSAFGDGCFGKVSVARRTGNPGLVVRCMAKLDMRIGGEPINPHPWNLDFLIGIGYDFLHLRPLLSHHGMAQHAFLNGRNACGIANVGTDVAVDALDSKLRVRLMWECNRLLRQGDACPGGN